MRSPFLLWLKIISAWHASLLLSIIYRRAQYFVIAENFMGVPSFVIAENYMCMPYFVIAENYLRAPFSVIAENYMHLPAFISA